MSAITNLQSLKWSDQISRDLTNLYSNIRSNAFRYRAAVTAGVPVADIAAVITSDATEYGRRLDRHEQAIVAVPAVIGESLQRLNLAPAEYREILDGARSVTNQILAAPKTTNAQINAIANGILSLLPDLGSLWPE